MRMNIGFQTVSWLAPLLSTGHWLSWVRRLKRGYHTRIHKTATIW